MTDQPPPYPPADQPAAYQPPSYPAPSYSAPAYGGAPTADNYPGKSLGVAALVCSCIFFIGISVIAGLIMGIIARNQSKAVGMPNTPAKAAIIISSILIGLGIIIAIIAIIFSIAVAAACSGSAYCN